MQKIALRSLLAAAFMLTASHAGAQISSAEFAARRDSLAARIGEGVVVAFGGRTPVSDFGPFYQLPAFRYLTNFLEPDAAFVMVVHAGRGSSTIFVSPVDPRLAFYYGRRPDSATAARALGIQGRPFASLSPMLDSLAATGVPFYTLADFADADFARADSLTRGNVFMTAFAAAHPSLVVKNAHPIVDELRAHKSPAEIELLQRAAVISAAGHLAAMLAKTPAHEYEIQAVLESTFTEMGGERVAYGSIVGSGEHGTQLHYMTDQDTARRGDLVVIDAATQYKGYAADITRTLPVSGKFTPRQRELYQLVRDAQAAAERNSLAGMSAAAASDSASGVRARGLARLGLIDSVNASFDPPWAADCAHAPASCRQSVLWTIHGLGHGLGLAVHDPAGYYYGKKVFMVGDVFTIEPGLYISSASLAALPDTPRNRAFIANVRSAVARYDNTGVRIEDDYVVTPCKLVRLSMVPREMNQIEAMMSNRRH